MSIETPRTRAEYEDFLYLEAALLDEWRLDEWFDLFAEGATYEVPTASAEPDVDSAEALFYVADDYLRLRYRVERLKKPGAHAEWPRSTAARVISNVRILGAGPDGVDVRSVFATYRAKDEKTDCFFGHHRYLLRTVDGVLKIAAKRSLLDMSSLRPHGRVSIIV
jgi:p-cumate 2,3-dioxygenase beta subunit